MESLRSFEVKIFGCQAATWSLVSDDGIRTAHHRFTCHDGVNDIARKILEIGDLKIADSKPKEVEDNDIPIRSTGLARSKSDHRLVAEFRRRGDDAGSPPRRRFGESRYSREDNKSR